MITAKRVWIEEDEEILDIPRKIIHSARRQAKELDYDFETALADRIVLLLHELECCVPGLRPKFIKRLREQLSGYWRE